MIDFINSIFDLAFGIIDLLSHSDYSQLAQPLSIAAVFILVLCVGGIIRNLYKSNQIFKAVHVFDEPQSAPMEKNVNLENWRKILSQGSSDSENDRKIALVAADSLIEKILDLAGYSGDNLGERLKQIEPSDLDSLDALWEAHKIRNRIAHEAGYTLSREDALRALADFEKTLSELEYI